MAKKGVMTETLRQVVRDSGQSLYAICKATGWRLNEDSLSRFMRGEQSLRLDKADLLAEHFGLELTKRKGKR